MSFEVSSGDAIIPRERPEQPQPPQYHTLTHAYTLVHTHTHAAYTHAYTQTSPSTPHQVWSDHFLMKDRMISSGRLHIATALGAID